MVWRFIFRYLHLLHKLLLRDNSFILLYLSHLLRLIITWFLSLPLSLSLFLITTFFSIWSTASSSPFPLSSSSAFSVSFFYHIIDDTPFSKFSYTWFSPSLFSSPSSTSCCSSQCLPPSSSSYSCPPCCSFSFSSFCCWLGTYQMSTAWTNMAHLMIRVNKSRSEEVPMDCFVFGA